MSRNLGETDCQWCGGNVVMLEGARPITETEAGGYFAEFSGMLVANAHCKDCEAPYLAWVLGAGGKWPQRRLYDEHEPVVRDLSYRSSFNDEPGPDDFPKYAITREPVRRPWTLRDAVGSGRLSYLSKEDQERAKALPLVATPDLSEARRSDVVTLAQAIFLHQCNRARIIADDPPDRSYWEKLAEHSLTAAAAFVDESRKEKP